MKQPLHEVLFRNDFVGNFPGDDSGNRQPRQTPGLFWSKAEPTPVPEVKLLGWSENLAEVLELQYPGKEDTEILGGNRVTATMHPYAACYAGHQFGSWAGQLGDGRAITLGERVTSTGEKWELQLKGAGQTAYSRRADGRAVLRSSVREYLMSEAMHHLGVPTTRALSLVSTGQPVLRDMFYDGNAAHEPGAIVLRAAPTFLRFGNFEMPSARGEVENLRKLVEWTITHYFPHISGEDKILAWYKEVVNRTAFLMVEWLRVGFVHGVMNTDNMSILGLTIDYGPYSFVDQYDPLFTPNTTDLPGRRYAFGRQASVAKWNLGCLGGALAPLFPDTEELVKIIDTYDDVYWQQFYTMMGKKIGLDSLRAEDGGLLNDLEKMLRTVQPDMTLFFAALQTLPVDKNDKAGLVSHFSDSFYKEPNEDEAALLVDWVEAYHRRMATNRGSREESLSIMQAANPKFILRNYLLHRAIEDLQNGDDAAFRKLEKAIQQPYGDAFPELWGKRPDWANEKAGCSMLSCSS
ncbi:MAG: YdiU family protein [Chitinophagaceae bacterium]|nr:MAG: YdiU family protein [Chitinophagaceae bacterium]